MARRGRNWRRWGLRPLLRLGGTLRGAGVRALRHDCLNLAQSAAYSAMVALFPALVVTAAVFTLLPQLTMLRLEVGEFFDEVLPANVFPLLTGYFAGDGKGPHTVHALVLAGVVSVTGGSSVMATLMEGLRRAEGGVGSRWSFLQTRLRSVLLVGVSLVPLALATALVMFGQWITAWLAEFVMTEVKPAFYGVALAVRWVVSLAGVAGVTGAIYHLGSPRRQRWTQVLPGAVAATGIWFVVTLAFGWYVTRFANYTQVYGSLGAGIALLFWLYIVFLTVLVGAEFNAELYAERGRMTGTHKEHDEREGMGGAGEE